MSGGSAWTTSDVERLNDMRRRRLPVKIIAHELGRTAHSVGNYLRYVPASGGLPADRRSTPPRPKWIKKGAWSPRELVVLHERYPKGGSAAVLAVLKARSKGAVNTKAKKLSIKYNPDRLALPDFPCECSGCGKVLHYSKGSQYLKRKPSGLCRGCCNRRPRSEAHKRKVAEATRRAFENNPEHRVRHREAVRAAMANLSEESREKRRQQARVLGKSNRGNMLHPAGSPCRLIAGKRAAETRKAKQEAARLAELRRPRTFEEKLQLVLEGKARVVPVIRPVSNDPEYTLGGVSAGWAA